MGHAAQAHEQHDAAPTPTPTPAPPNEYGGRVPLQPELPRAVDVTGLAQALRRLARRRRSPLSRVEIAVARVILADTCDRSGRCDASTMGIVTRAGCSRSEAFRALTRLEAVGLMEPREQVDPCFSTCTNTIAHGWRGFRACNRMRAAARAQGRPFTCVAHHGRTFLRWRVQTVRELEAVLAELEPKPIRRPKNAPDRADYRTPTGAPYRTGVEEPYRTPNPGSGVLKTGDVSSSFSPGSRPGARARDGHPATDDASRPAASPPGSGPPPAPACPSPPAAPRPTTPTRAAARPTPPPAFDGFAPRIAESSPAEAGERGRARSGPSSPAAADVDAVLAAHREHAMRTTLARAPASQTERGLVARELAGGATLRELLAVMRGLAGVPDERFRRLVYVFRRDPDGTPTRLEHARSAGVERELVDERRAAAAAARPRTVAVPVVDLGTLAAQARAERLEGARAAFRAASEAWLRDTANADAMAALNVAREELARLQGGPGR